MRLCITTTLAAILLLACGPAEARHHYRHHHRAAAHACSGWFCPAQAQFAARQAPTYRHRARAHQFAAVGSDGGVVSHPAGCPGRAFCGCGAAVRVFGSPVRSLWLASAWFRFPRAAPAPGMVGVRSHHVFVLEADLGGGVWRVYDANSGGGATRVHARSISGYTIVNPHGGTYASM